jgi:DNA repair protein RecO (recombination protein O)
VTLYRDEGVVLRTMRLGEADRIVTMLCRSRGKVRAVAKGVRKTTSRFGGRLEPMSHVALLCWQGRELDIVNQAEVIDSYRQVREDFSRVSKAYAMLEVSDKICVEHHAAPELYELLVRALGALASEDSALVVPAFFLRVLAVEGSTPILDECASCGSDAELVAFELLEGGALCRNCRRGRPLSPEALGLLRRCFEPGGLAQVLREPAGPVATEVTEIMNEAMETHLDRQIRSVRAAPGA